MYDSDFLHILRKINGEVGGRGLDNRLYISCPKHPGAPSKVYYEDGSLVVICSLCKTKYLVAAVAGGESS